MSETVLTPETRIVLHPHPKDHVMIFKCDRCLMTLSPPFFDLSKILCYEKDVVCGNCCHRILSKMIECVDNQTGYKEPENKNKNDVNCFLGSCTREPYWSASNIQIYACELHKQLLGDVCGKIKPHVILRDVSSGR